MRGMHAQSRVLRCYRQQRDERAGICGMQGTKSLIDTLGHNSQTSQQEEEGRQAPWSQALLDQEHRALRYTNA